MSDDDKPVTEPRKKIEMPRSRYVDETGMPAHPIFGSFRFWPRELQADFAKYSRYLDRLWNGEFRR
jgi:hypothetical protein